MGEEGDVRVVHGVPKILPRPYITAVNFFSKMRVKRHFLVRRIERLTTTHKLHSTLVAFPVRPHGIVGTSCHPRLLAASRRGLTLLRRANISCYFVLSFAHRMSRLATRRFVSSVLESHCQIRALIVKCSRHFKRGHDRNFRGCYHCNSRVKVRIVHTHTYIYSSLRVDSSIVHGVLRRNRMSQTTHYLNCSCFLSNAIIDNCRMKEGVKFPATGLDMSSPSGLIPTSNICTIRIAFSKRACGNVLGVNAHPAVKGNPRHSVRIGVLRFRSSVCSGFVQLSFMGCLHPRLGFSKVRKLVTRLRRSTTSIRTLLKGVRGIG